MSPTKNDIALSPTFLNTERPTIRARMLGVLHYTFCVKNELSSKGSHIIFNVEVCRKIHYARENGVLQQRTQIPQKKNLNSEFNVLLPQPYFINFSPYLDVI